MVNKCIGKSMTEEHHKDHLDLTEIKAELATTNAHLENVIKMFHDHLADDKKTVEKVDGLLIREARLDSRIIALSAMCTFAGFIIGKLPIKWF